MQGSVDAAAAEAEAKTEGLLQCWYVSKFVETAEEEHKFVLQDGDLESAVKVFERAEHKLNKYTTPSEAFFEFAAWCF